MAVSEGAAAAATEAEDREASKERVADSNEAFVAANAAAAAAAADFEDFDTIDITDAGVGVVVEG